MTARTSDVDERVAHRYERVAVADRVRVDAYVRSLAPAPGPKRQQERVLEGLQRLETQGIVDEQSVSVWGEALCLDGPYRDTAACRRIEDRLESFREWAADAAGTVELPFETQPVSSHIVEAEYERLVPPRVCLAIYAGGELELVAPCRIGDTHVTVTDVLDRLTRTDRTVTGNAEQSTTSI